MNIKERIKYLIDTLENDRFIICNNEYRNNIKNTSKEFYLVLALMSFILGISIRFPILLALLPFFILLLIIIHKLDNYKFDRMVTIKILKELFEKFNSENSSKNGSKNGNKKRQPKRSKNQPPLIP